MTGQERILGGIAMLLAGVAIPLWFAGSIDWGSEPHRAPVQIALLVAAYVLLAAAVVAALVVARRAWIRRQLTGTATPLHQS